MYSLNFKLTACKKSGIIKLTILCPSYFIHQILTYVGLESLSRCSMSVQPSLLQNTSANLELSLCPVGSMK